jgi:membrane-bound lytic murein transglycosylase D
MHRVALFLAIILSSFPAGHVLAVEPVASARERLFPRPEALEPQIRFWKAVFTEYSTNQVVLHDALHLDKVYKVLDFRPQLADGMSAGEVDRLRAIETDVEMARLRATLLRLDAAGPQPQDLTAEEQQVWDLFRDDASAGRFRAAAEEKRLRSQRGLRERFADAVRISRGYLPEMERIFQDEGLPLELTRLPLIESCFNLRAYSKVGAAGIWQFMPATGRRFMRVDGLVDERRDPLASTRAAARFLAELHDHLGAWPLAITAYNHGPYGIARAVDAVGSSDIATIVRRYDGPAFGFASRNFYAEFLAALEVDRNHEAHFGKQPVEAPPRASELRLTRALGIEQAARLAGTDRDALAQLNPALSSLVVAGRRSIPAGYRLRVPHAVAEEFETRLARLPAAARVVRAAARGDGRSDTRRTRSAVAKVAYVRHRVQKGQTLSHIAKKHGVSVDALRSANRLGRKTLLRIGQSLRVPVRANEA